MESIFVAILCTRVCIATLSYIEQMTRVASNSYYIN